MLSLGINIGSSSLKFVLLKDNSEIVWSYVTPHDGNFQQALHSTLALGKIPAGTPTLVTGTEGRNLFAIDSVIE